MRRVEGRIKTLHTAHIRHGRRQGFSLTSEMHAVDMLDNFILALGKSRTLNVVRAISREFPVAFYL